MFPSPQPDHIDIEKPFIIATSRAGLANRLLCIIGLWRAAEILNRPFGICWPQNWDICEDSFESLFDMSLPVYPFLQGNNEFKVVYVPIIRGCLPWDVVFDIPKEPCYVVHCATMKLPNDVTKVNWYPYCQRFNPTSTIQKNIQHFTDNHDFANAVGVHIRLGDAVRVSKAVAPAVSRAIEVLQFIAKRNAKITFFVASDELNVEAEIVGALNGRAFHFHKRLMPAARKNSGHESVADLWLLSQTNCVLGSFGTYGRFAALMGGVPRLDIFEGAVPFENRNISYPQIKENRSVSVVGNKVLAKFS